MKKTHNHHGIILAPALKKHFVKEQEVLTTSYATAIPITQFTTSLEIPIIPTKQEIQKTHHNFSLKGYYFQDSEDTMFHTLDFFYIKNNITKNLSLGADSGYFAIEKKNYAKYSGTRYGISLLIPHFTFRLGINLIGNFTEFVPTLIYENSYKKHSYSLEYTHQNALFYTLSLTPYEKRIKANHLSFSDYIAFTKNTDLWANLQIDYFSNDDTQYTAQYDWQLYYSRFYTQNLSYHIALEGWYTSHTKEHKDFYSPHFSDTTLLRIDPLYKISHTIDLKGKLGIGYSFADEAQAYKVGLSLFAHPKKNFSYDFGCLYSNATRVTSKTSYDYEECSINLGYLW